MTLGIAPQRAKRRWTAVVATVVVALLCTGAFSVVMATLAGGSTFESGDGNLVVNGGAGSHDWNNPVEPITCPASAPGSGANCGLDLVKNQSDNSLGQGAKEDDLAPSVVSGSIPPSKDDLSRFYVNKERVGGKDFLYLAWERSNLLGSAHMDFEFNQSSTASANGVTKVRTAGDLLIDFDFGGSGVPVLAKHTWITSGSTANCEANNTLPCWDKGVDLGANAEAAVNSVPVSDTNPPAVTLDGNTKNGINSTFGEAGINLTDSNIFPTNQCEHFGAATLKSRSSGNSFTSELKDFIAPIPVNISNCGSLVIKKRTNPRGVNHDFAFHNVDIPTTGTVFSHALDGSGNFTLNDNGNSGTTDSDGNTQTVTNVLAGTYHVTEADPTPGFDLTDITCTTGGSGNVGTRTATFTVSVGSTVTCTFTNTQRGTIVVKKRTSPRGQNHDFGFHDVDIPASGPTYSHALDASGNFSLNDNGNSGTADSTGNTQTITNVVPGTYHVTEADPSPAFALTAISCTTGGSGSVANRQATFVLGAGGSITCTFTNALQLGAIKITKQSDKSGNAGLDGAKFSIKDANGTAITGSPFTTANGGVACADGLPIGDYKVQETQAPIGYSIDDTTVHTVTVTGSNAKCTDASFTGQTVPFFDTPLTNLTITASSQDTGPGGSNSTISCVNSGSTDIGNSPEGPANSVTVTANGLAPGTYTCTVVVDP